MYINFIKSYLKIFIKVLLLLFVTIKLTNAQNTINTSAKFAILIDHETGRILLNKKCDQRNLHMSFWMMRNQSSIIQTQLLTMIYEDTALLELLSNPRSIS